MLHKARTVQDFFEISTFFKKAKPKFKEELLLIF